MLGYHFPVSGALLLPRRPFGTRLPNRGRREMAIQSVYIAKLISGAGERLVHWLAGWNERLGSKTENRRQKQMLWRIDRSRVGNSEWKLESSLGPRAGLEGQETNQNSEKAISNHISRDICTVPLSS